jgi:hypothetical protein
VHATALFDLRQPQKAIFGICSSTGLQQLSFMRHTCNTVEEWVFVPSSARGAPPYIGQSSRARDAVQPFSTPFEAKNCPVLSPSPLHEHVFEVFDQNNPSQNGNIATANGRTSRNRTCPNRDEPPPTFAEPPSFGKTVQDGTLWMKNGVGWCGCSIGWPVMLGERVEQGGFSKRVCLYGCCKRVLAHSYAAKRSLQ